MKLRRMKELLGTALLLVLPAKPILGQTALWEPPQGRTVPASEQVEGEMASARFRLGAVRLLPFFRLSNVGWTNNALVTAEGPVDDYTATVSAGARVIVPFGSKVFLRGNVAPTYDWYYQTESLRSFGGDYSGEVLALFNRLTMSAGAGYAERIQSASTEVARDVLTLTRRGSGKAEVRLLDRLFAFGAIEQASYRVDDPNETIPGLAPASDLDRTETGYRGGLRYQFTSALSFGLMGQRVSTRFDVEPEERDNDADAILFAARYDRDRFYLEGTIGVEQGKAVIPSETFPEYSTGTYGYFASYLLTRRLELQARGGRRPTASLFLDNPYFFETRNALGVRHGLGRRSSLRGSVEVGSNRYVNPVLVTATGEVVTRVDDIVRWTAGVEFNVSRAIAVGVNVGGDRYDSNIDYYDRDTLRVYGGLSISADFRREERR